MIFDDKQYCVLKYLTGNGRVVVEAQGIHLRHGYRAPAVELGASVQREGIILVTTHLAENENTLRKFAPPFLFNLFCLSLFCPGQPGWESIDEHSRMKLSSIEKWQHLVGLKLLISRCATNFARTI